MAPWIFSCLCSSPPEMSGKTHFTRTRSVSPNRIHVHTTSPTLSEKIPVSDWAASFSGAANPAIAPSPAERIRCPE